MQMLPLPIPTLHQQLYTGHSVILNLADFSLGSKQFCAALWIEIRIGYAGVSASSQRKANIRKMKRKTKRF
jgi:hypothetical protein